MLYSQTLKFWKHVKHCLLYSSANRINANFGKGKNKIFVRLQFVLSCVNNTNL